MKPKFTLLAAATRRQPVHATSRRVPPAKLSRVSAAAALVVLSSAFQIPLTQAGPISLAQIPAGNGGREPAPNILISVDDSGSMGSSGMTALRNALTTSFSNTAVPDDLIRLGYQAMWRCRGFSGTPTASYGGTCPDTRVQRFQGTHRTKFNAWVNSLTAYNTTPSHAMVYNAGEAMKVTGVWSPFAKDPGVTETPLLACRKSFHIFMTDGEWNSEDTQVNGAYIKGRAGNADGTEISLPDGTSFDPYNTVPDPDNATLANTRIYRDTFGVLATTPYNNLTNAGLNTLADYAFQQWATDAQPTIPNQVRPIIRQAGPADFGTNGNPYMVPEYWNPKNNPSTWQGLTTYTIAFNNAANLPNTRTDKTVSISGVNTNIALPAWGGTTWSGDFAALIRGDNAANGRPITWGNPAQDSGLSRRQELWHMAINGRGRMVPATNATELSNAFAEIINQIIADTSAPLASIAANTQSVTTGTSVFTAGYDAAKWAGYLHAYSLQANYNLSTNPLWDAATVLESVTPANRLIFTHNETIGTSFDWASLSTTQQDLIKGTDAVTVGQARLNYIRGERSQEQSNSGALRNRNSKLGDIVNSNLWVVGKPSIGYTGNNYAAFRTANASRPTMIYVGANDGMLHGFSGSDGSEKMAYVPRGVYNKLRAYAEPSYTHQYFVDGHPFTGDIYDGTNWKTMLVGTLAGGGKGYFVLDVTNPASLTASSGPTLVVTDQTDTGDADIGHMYAEPTLDASNPARVVQITKLNNNRWALLMGNGVNSTDEKAVLLIQYLDGAKEVVKLVLDGTGANGNGLANPQVIDINGDGKADLAYAGDHLGNLWKIDLSSTTASNWGSYFKSGSTPVPLYVARDDSNARQPITTAPQWATHPTKGLMVAFGTGREMTVADRLTSSTQSLYAIWDDTLITPGGSPMMTGGSAVSGGRSSLVAQTQTSTITINSKKYFKTSNNAVPYTGAGAKRGWYLDWPTLGERSVNNGGMLSNRLLYMRSRVPANGSQDTSTEESCEPNATNAQEFLTVLDIVNGNAPTKPVFDTDGGGITGTEEPGVSRWDAGRTDRLMVKTGKPGELVSLGNIKSGGGNNPCTGANAQCIAVPQNLTEFGWRQLQ